MERRIKAINKQENEDGYAKPWVSRVMIMAILASLVLYGTFAVIQSRRMPPDSELIPSPFKPFDGSWAGRMIVKNQQGEVIEESEIEFENRHINARRFFRQEAHVVKTNLATGEREEFEMVHKADFERQHFSRRLLLDMQRRAEDYEGELNEDGSFTWTRETTSLKEVRREWIEEDRKSVV